MGGEKQTKLADASEEYREKLLDFVHRVDDQLNVSEKLEAGWQYASAHPVLTTASVVTLVLCSFPLMCFGAFVVVTMFFTFLSFMFVEGFLLTLGGVFLGTALMVTGAIALVISALLAMAYFTFHYGSKAAQAIIHKKQALFNQSHVEQTTGEESVNEE